MAAKRNRRGQFLKGTHWRNPQPFRDKAWLVEQYVNLARSTGDIAKQFGATPGAILFWLRKHKIKRRSTSGARSVKRWGQAGSDNPMWNRRGELNPRWLGGITPERQAFYTSQEWKSACSAVWKRDKATCQRCKLHRDDQKDMPFHIHHIESFAVRDLRSVVSNLVLLCEVCHDFVHSRRNVNREFLPKDRDSSAPA
jgi:transposase-like protein